jgi:hypothetical protein
MCLTAHNAMNTSREVVSFKLPPLYSPANNSRNPLDRRPGKSKRRSERYGENKKSLFLSGIEPRFIGSDTA